MILPTLGMSCNYEDITLESKGKATVLRGHGEMSLRSSQVQ